MLVSERVRDDRVALNSVGNISASIISDTVCLYNRICSSVVAYLINMINGINSCFVEVDEFGGGEE